MISYGSTEAPAARCLKQVRFGWSFETPGFGIRESQDTVACSLNSHVGDQLLAQIDFTYHWSSIVLMDDPGIEKLYMSLDE
jgi:hypothetical protein